MTEKKYLYAAIVVAIVIVVAIMIIYYYCHSRYNSIQKHMVGIWRSTHKFNEMSGIKDMIIYIDDTDDADDANDTNGTDGTKRVGVYINHGSVTSDHDDADDDISLHIMKMRGSPSMLGTSSTFSFNVTFEKISGDKIAFPTNCMIEFNMPEGIMRIADNKQIYAVTHRVNDISMFIDMVS